MRAAASAGGAQISEPLVVDTPQAWDDARAALAKLLEEAAKGGEVEAVSGGVAGVVQGGVLARASANLPAWQDADIAGALREMYPGAHIAVENDAVAACLGEARVGAGKGEQVVAYITVGTGVGGARAAGGAVEPRAFGYEPGRQIIDYRTGATVESVASGRSIAARYGTHISAASEEAQEEVARALAAAAYNAVAHWSPHVVVLGGAVIFGNPGIFERIGKHYGALPPIVPQMPPLLLGALGEKAGLVGALML
jgi:predicted NBD/HSP70 family sugar kinase